MEGVVSSNKKKKTRTLVDVVVVTNVWYGRASDELEHSRVRTRTTDDSP
jgi:hypothetical protein